MRHPGVVIGNNLHKEKHTSELATNFNNQLQLLSKIVETEPQSIYKAFVSGLKNKVTYFICTIPDMSELLLPLENTTRKNPFELLKVVKLAPTAKEHGYHYQHGTED